LAADASRRSARRPPCKPSVVEHRDEEAKRGQPALLAGSGQVSGGDARDDAAGADSREHGAARAADPLDGVERIEHGLDVGVKAPAGVPGVRVSPGDHEHLLAASDEVLDEAAVGGQVEGVVLVDGRRYHEHRDLADMFGLRTVLDELTHVGTHDDRAMVTAMLRPT
jgi:hypothetical protein